MTIEINDTRNKSQGVLWGELEQGKVYIDAYDSYCIFTDNEFIVKLDNGCTRSSDSYDLQFDKFIPVKCKLEVYG